MRMMVRVRVRVRVRGAGVESSDLEDANDAQ